MKLLIVEDNKTNIDLFNEVLGKYGDLEFVVVESRDSAFIAVEGQQFDLIILDLKIPTADGALDAHTTHGLSVHSRIREICIGTPVIFCSGFGDLSFLGELLADSDKWDIWGKGTEIPLARHYTKEHIAQCFDLIKLAIDEVNLLQNIEISVGGADIQLDYHEKRVFQLFSRTVFGAAAHVRQIGGGLSSVRAFQIDVRNQQDNTVCFAFAKIGLIEKLIDERKRYDVHVSPALENGKFPHHMRFIIGGAGNCGGLFYSMAKNFNETLMDVLCSDPNSAVEIAKKVRVIVLPWQTAGLTAMTGKDVLALFVKTKDWEVVKSRCGFSFDEFLSTKARIKLCPQHFDLHGLNVLVRDKSEPILIDFGEVCHAPSCIDPIIMELSLLFHPACAGKWPDWPSLEQAKQWHNIDHFAANCPVADYVRFCRSWALDVSGGDRAFFMTAACYALRQLKYPKTNHALASTVAGVCFEKLNALA